jgi:hypothetical protein
MHDPSVPSISSNVATVSRKWLLKMSLISLALIAFGVWGYLDATIYYPRRGIAAAEYLELQYLQTLSAAGQTSRASIDDPAATLDRLRQQHRDAALQGTDLALHNWLDQLDLVGKLEPATASTLIPRTDFRTDEQGNPIQVSSALSRLDDLKARWTTTSGATKSASPLSAFDLPSQWIIMAVGLGIGLYILVLILIAKGRRYQWNPATQALTLPDGATLTPADIEEFDKRKWHRLYITLKVKPEHPQKGGKAVEIDLMRYDAAEPWVLEMERTAFPDAIKEPAPAETPAPA